VKTAIVYLPIKPEKAKEMNLPLKVPVLAKDLPKILDENTIPIDVLIRGLEAQFEISKDEYYLSYLLYFYYEKVKIFMNKGDYRAAQEHLRKVGALKKDYRYDFFSALWRIMNLVTCCIFRRIFKKLFPSTKNLMILTETSYCRF